MMENGRANSMTDDERETWRANLANARAALGMIREAIEAHAPPGTLPSEEAVLGLYGPEPTDEAQALCEALRKSLS